MKNNYININLIKILINSMKHFINNLFNLKKTSFKKSLFFLIILLTILTIIISSTKTNTDKKRKKTNFSNKSKNSQSFLNKLKNSYNSLKSKIKDIFKSKEKIESSIKVNTSKSNSTPKELFEHNFYDSEVPAKWNMKIGVAYRDMAAIGYMNQKDIESQLNEIRKGAAGDKHKISGIMRVLFEEQNWEFIGNHTDGDFSFNVIRNKSKGKVILTFSGTISNTHILKQIIYSGGKNYFRHLHKLAKVILIVDYYQSLYKTVFPYLKELISKAKDKSIKQYIFTGHSRGGAMASLAAFDLIQEKLIEKTANSPVLITFGQPRVGNYAFANELMKAVPIVYRIVNRYDIVSGFPACIIDKKTHNCKNEFGKEDIDVHLNEYKQPQKSRWNRLINKTEFFPWHFGGLVYVKTENEAVVCENSEPKYQSNCRLETSHDLDYHINYFGYRILNLFEPNIFGYNLFRGNNNDEQSNEKSARISSSSERNMQINDKPVNAPSLFVMKEKPNKEKGVDRFIKKFMQQLRKINVINRRK